MLYAWRNVPRTDGYSPAQLLFGRRQRTNLPLLPFQNLPIDFNVAATAKDAIHSSSTSYHDLHKRNLPLLSPGQSVLIQDPKSLLWNSSGIVVSIRPDKLSYVINTADRQFVRPRRLLRLRTSSDDRPTSPDASPPPLLPRRSSRLQSRATAAPVNTTCAPLSTSSLATTPSTSAPSCLHSCSAWVKTPLTVSTKKNWSAPTSKNLVSLPLSPDTSPFGTPLSSEMTLTYPSIPCLSPTVMRQPLTSRSVASPSSTCIGPPYPRAFLRSWPWSSSASVLRGAAISVDADNGNPGLGMPSCSSPSPVVCTTPARRLTPNPVRTPVLPLRGSSERIPSSSTVRRSPLCSTLRSVSPAPQLSSSSPLPTPLDNRLCNFPPLPPPAVCRDVLPNTNTPTRRLLPPLRNYPLPTTPGSPGRSTSSRAVVRQESTLSLSPSIEDSDARSVVRPVHSVSDYHRSGLAACDDRPGSVSRLIVRY